MCILVPKSGREEKRMTVYVEAYALINMVMDAFLLLLCALLSGRRLKKFGAAAACVIAGGYSVMAHTVLSGSVISFPGKITCAALMVFFAFGRMKITPYLRIFAAFFLASFVAGGTGFGLIYLLGSGGFGFGAMLLTVFATTAGVYVIVGRRKTREFLKWRIPVIVEGETGSIRLEAFIDSGNHLTEPITALPVAICFAEDVQDMLAPSNLRAGFTSVGGIGEMELFVPRAVYALKNGKKEKLADVYIAFSASQSSDDVELLLPPSVMG